MTYRNSIGKAEISGNGAGALRLLSAVGLEPAAKEYTVATYGGQHGQETLSARALPRTITLALEYVGKDVRGNLPRLLEILQEPGTLFIKTGNIHRRIGCSQVQITDVNRVLMGEIVTFAVQFVCDNPYFEDGEDIIAPLYQRTKGLSTPFTLPRAFGEIVVGGTVKNRGSIAIEPIITIYYPGAIAGADSISITNQTTGKSICLDYVPSGEDTVVIDIKNRKITSRIEGSLLNFITDDTFLGDFVLQRGSNNIDVDLGDVAGGFAIECKFSNLYSEAVIV